jgi:hypothetical protein
MFFLQSVPRRRLNTPIWYGRWGNAVMATVDSLLIAFLLLWSDQMNWFWRVKGLRNCEFNKGERKNGDGQKSKLKWWEGMENFSTAFSVEK